MPPRAPSHKSQAAEPARRRESGMFLCVVLLSGVVALGAILWRLRNPPLSPHDHRQHPWKHFEKFFPDEMAERVLAKIKSIGEMRVASKDSTAVREDAGEAMPWDHPACQHPLLIRSKNGSHCVLPQRVDVARHFFKLGGREGSKELYEDLLPRTQPFVSYLFAGVHDEDLAPFQEIFHSDAYIEQAQQVCGNKSVFDPIQTNLIAVLPGGELPMHLDVPWFFGATRFTIPQWLLVAMDQSGLWKDRAISQIQGVAWLTKDTPGRERQGGEFFFYPNGPRRDAATAPRKFNAAVVMDGCRVIHGVNRFEPGAYVPRFPQHADVALRFVEDETWQLESDQEVLQEYRTEELRFSFVWRARCFATEEEKERFHRQESTLSVEEVLDALVKDPRRRGRLGAEAPRPRPLDLALMIIDEYIPYPMDNLHKAIIPYNYCVLPRLLSKGSLLRKVLEPVAEWLCAPPVNPLHHVM